MSSHHPGEPAGSASTLAQLQYIRARHADAEARLSSSGRESDDSSDDDQHPREEQVSTSHLVSQLLPSPPSSPLRTAAAAAAPSGQAKTQRHRPGKSVTVRDIKNRSCWICSDGDEGDAKPEGTRRWVHPCKCSLIAHESCLLTWIRSRRASGTPDPNRQITCPQCSHVYKIVEHKPVTLQVFEAGDGVLRSIIPVGGAAIVGGGVLVAATAYGCTAIRLWMGERAAKRLLGGSWPWHFYVDIPLIPFALIVSRLRFFDRALLWLTTVAAFPMTPLPFSPNALSWAHPYAPTWRWRSQHQIRLSRAYPPGPALTVMLAPIIRIAYMSLKRRVTRRVLSRFVRKSSGQASSSAQRSDVRRRVIVLGQENPLVDASGLGDVGVDEQGRPREVPAGADAVNDDDQQTTAENEAGVEGDEEGVQQTIYVTPQSLSRLILGALSTPVIAAVMGKLLAKLAGWNFWLRRLLGMQFQSPLNRAFGLGKGSSFDSTSSSQSSMARLLSSGSTQLGDRLEEERILYNNYDDLDPVWFRNTIGAGLFIVAKDICQLGYRYLRLDHAKQGSKRTRIIDRPFEGPMVDGLDLREGS